LHRRPDDYPDGALRLKKYTVSSEKIKRG
jgi:hypothetical protein